MKTIARIALLASCTGALAAALACGGQTIGDQAADGGGAGDGSGPGDARSSVDVTTDAGAGADGASADVSTEEGAAPLPPGAWGCNVPPPTGKASPGPQPAWVVQGQMANGGDFVLFPGDIRTPLAVDGTSGTVFGGNALSQGAPGTPPITGSVTFGEGEAVVPPGAGFLVRVGAQGAPAWTKVLSATSPDGGAAAASVGATATGADGRIAVVGPLSGTLDLGCGAFSGDPTDPGPGFLAVLDAGGACLWSKAYPSPIGGHAFEWALAFDASNDLFAVAAGMVQNGYGVSIEKLDPSGSSLWALKGTSPDPAPVEDLIAGAGVDAQGDIVVGINYAGPLTLGGQVLQHAPDSESASLVKVTAGGSVAWAQAFSTSPAPFLGAMAVAPTGAIAVTGALSPGGALAACAPTTSCQYPQFLAMLGPDGAVQWVRFFPAGPWVPYGVIPVAVDPSGNVAVALSLWLQASPGCGVGPLNLGGTDLPTGTTPPLAIAAYAPDGTHRWDTVIPCVEADGAGCPGDTASLVSLAYLPGGDLVVGGRVAAPRTLVLGSTVVTSPPVPDNLGGNVFVTRLH